MTTTLTIVPPAPFINANHRLHWRKKAELTKAWRAAGYAAAYDVPDHLYDTRVSIVCSIRFPDNRRRDVMNLAPTIKAAIDGIVSSQRFLLDDSDAHIEGPDLRRDLPNGTPLVTIRIEAIT